MGTAIVKAAASIAVANRMLSPIQRATKIKIRTEAQYDLAGIQMKKADEFLSSPIVKALQKQCELTDASHKHAVMIRDQFVKNAKECKKIFARKRIEFKALWTAKILKRLQKEFEKEKKIGIAEARKEARKLIARGEKRAAKELIDAAINMEFRPAARLLPVESGFVEKRSYSWAVVNASLVPEKYWSIDPSKVSSDVDAFGFDAKIPGIQVSENRTEHTRRSRK